MPLLKAKMPRVVGVPDDAVVGLVMASAAEVATDIELVSVELEDDSLLVTMRAMPLGPTG